MIDARELRLGNLVLGNNSEEPIIVKRLNIADEGRSINTFNEKLFNPIELTEEWLLKLGAKDNNYFLDIMAGRKRIKFEWYIRIVSTGERRSFYCSKYPHIKYAHQLQNLYFALTGKELTI